MDLAGVGAATFGIRNVFVIAGIRSILGGLVSAVMFRTAGPTQDAQVAVAEAT